MSNIYVLLIFVNMRYLPAPTMKLWGGVLIFGQKFTKYRVLTGMVGWWCPIFQIYSKFSNWYRVPNLGWVFEFLKKQFSQKVTTPSLTAKKFPTTISKKKSNIFKTFAVTKNRIFLNCV